MSDEGYRGATGGELRDVGELIASLGLEGAAGLAAPRIERQAAVASYDCAGGREGLEDMMVLRIEIAREVAEEMDPEDARLIGEFWANE